MKKEIYEYLSNQHNDPIMERKQCLWCREDFAIFDGDLKLLEKISPTIGGEKFPIPSPKLCPDCRERRRLSFRNDRKIFKNKDFLTHQALLSSYSAEYNGKVIDRKRRRSEIDNTNLGQEYNPELGFLRQFYNLNNLTIKRNLTKEGNHENSEYTHFTGWLKNCYLSFDSGKSEDTHYSVLAIYAKNSMDCYRVLNSEQCYECNDVNNSFKLFYSSFCNECSDSVFLEQCDGCQNCIASYGLKNKQYFVFNEFVGEEKYKQIRNDIFAGSYSYLQNIKNRYLEFKNTITKQNLVQIHTNNCSGNNIKNAENLLLTFDSEGIKDSRYCRFMAGGTEDCMDVSTFGESMEASYELSGCGSKKGENHIMKSYFSSYVFYGGNMIFYSNNIHNNGSFLFGCSDLVGKKYCILNKQYSKEDRENTVKKIIKELQTQGRRGEFLDPIFSQYPYNDTIAVDFYPVRSIIANGQEKIINPNGKGVVTVQEPDKFVSNAFLNLGGGNIPIKRRTKDYEIDIPENMSTINAEDLPDNINSISDDILNKAIICNQSKRPFRIVKPELEFYRKHKLTLPRIHPDIRHQSRLSRGTDKTLHKIKCDQCQKEILSNYNNNPQFKVYCKSCYDKEIY